VETKKVAFALYGKDETFFHASGMAELIIKKCSFQPLDFKKIVYPSCTR